MKKPQHLATIKISGIEIKKLGKYAFKKTYIPTTKLVWDTMPLIKKYSLLLGVMFNLKASVDYDMQLQEISIKNIKTEIALYERVAKDAEEKSSKLDFYDAKILEHKKRVSLSDLFKPISSHNSKKIEFSIEEEIEISSLLYLDALKNLNSLKKSLNSLIQHKRDLEELNNILKKIIVYE